MAAQLVDSGTVYLIIGAALIFGACAYAAKRIFRQLTLKQVGLISVVTIVTIGIIWGFLGLNTRKHNAVEPPPEVNQRAPQLRPSPD